MADIREHGSLVLVIDDDAHALGAVRAALEDRGYQVVHASNAMAALELIHRLPGTFHFVLTELDLKGFPALALMEALRLFRPDLPVLCMAGKRIAALGNGCLRKPLVAEELDAQLVELQVGPKFDGGVGGTDDVTVARARARFAREGNLVEAALELARGLRG